MTNANNGPALSVQDGIDQLNKLVPDPDSRKDIPLAIMVNGYLFIITSVEADADYVVFKTDKRSDHGECKLLTTIDEPDTHPEG